MVSSPREVSKAGSLRPGIALVLVTVLVSGISNVVNFRAVQGTNVDAWIAVRNLTVAALLVPLAFFVGRGSCPRLTRKDWARLATIGFVGGAIPFLLYFHGFQLAAQEGGAASASLGYRSLFLVASVLGVLVLREKVPRRFVLGASLLMGGNLLLLSLTGPLWTDGTALVLLATALWAVEYTLSRRALRSLPSATVALGRMGFGAVFLVAYLGLTGQAGAIVGFGPADWTNLGLSALLLFAFVSTWYAGLKTVDLAVGTSLLVLAFPITWVLGILFGGVALAPGPAAGAALILLGAAIVVGMASLRGGWAAVIRYARSIAARAE